VFSSACVASRKSSIVIHEAETIRPLNKFANEVNANDVEVPKDADSDEEEEGVEAGDRLTEEVEGTKRRRFIERVVEDPEGESGKRGPEGESGEPEGDCVEGCEQDAGDFER